MPKHDPRVSLGQMLDHAREALDISRDKTREDLERDRLLQLSVVRLLEVLGEAANRVPPGTQATLPAISWRAIIGMRHRLIHGYDAVDLDVVWSILRQDLPRLVEALEDALRR